MSDLKHLVVALILTSLCAGASAQVLYFEDFESFAVGTVLHEEAGWSDEQQHRFACSSTDAVRVFDITEGKWVLTAMQYIPSGTNGTTRFHMQNAYRNGAIGRSVQWAFSLSDGAITEDYDENASASIIYRSAADQGTLGITCYSYQSSRIESVPLFRFDSEGRLRAVSLHSVASRYQVRNSVGWCGGLIPLMAIYLSPSPEIGSEARDFIEETENASGRRVPPKVV